MRQCLLIVHKNFIDKIDQVLERSEDAFCAMAAIFLVEKNASFFGYDALRSCRVWRDWYICEV